MNSEVSLVDGEDENNLQNVITNDGAIIRLTVQPPEFQEMILGWPSAAARTDVYEMSQKSDNKMDLAIVKQEHELLTFKTEPDEASSLKNENAGDEERSNDETGTRSEVSSVLDCDIKKETRSVICDDDGNYLVDEDYKFPVDNDEHETSNDYPTSTANEVFIVMKSDVSMLDEEEEKKLQQNSLASSGTPTEIVGQISQDFHNAINDYTVKEECELTVKTEAFSFEEENCNSNEEEKSNDCKTGTWADVKVEARSITDDAEGNDLVDNEEYGLPVATRNRKPFECNVCDYRAVNKHTLIRHMQTHTGEKPFPCNACDYRAVHKHTLIRHMRSHSGEKPFQCKLCDYRAVHNHTLIRHMRSHTGEKPHQCKVCDYRAVQKENLKAHMQTHTGEKPFQCNVCDYRTAQKQNLTKHMRTHSGEKPFHCDYCEFSTNQKQNLIIHTRTHTGEKPFQCNVCEYRAVHKQNLVKHMRTHTGEKPFPCSVCDYRTINKQNLKAHMRIHTGEKPFQCSVCDYRAAHKQNLKTHMQTHTGEKSF